MFFQLGVNCRKINNDKSLKHLYNEIKTTFCHPDRIINHQAYHSFIHVIEGEVEGDSGADTSNKDILQILNDKVCTVISLNSIKKLAAVFDLELKATVLEDPADYLELFPLVMQQITIVCKKKYNNFASISDLILFFVELIMKHNEINDLTSITNDVLWERKSKLTLSLNIGCKKHLVYSILFLFQQLQPMVFSDLDGQKRTTLCNCMLLDETIFGGPDSVLDNNTVGNLLRSFSKTMDIHIVFFTKLSPKDIGTMSLASSYLGHMYNDTEIMRTMVGAKTAFGLIEMENPSLLVCPELSAVHILKNCRANVFNFKNSKSGFPGFFNKTYEHFFLEFYEKFRETQWEKKEKNSISEFKITEPFLTYLEGENFMKLLFMILVSVCWSSKDTSLDDIFNSLEYANDSEGTTKDSFNSTNCDDLADSLKNSGGDGYGDMVRLIDCLSVFIQSFYFY